VEDDVRTAVRRWPRIAWAVTAALGIEVVAPPKVVPTGRNMLARHPGGALMEYAEHRPQPGEVGGESTG
jgi:hypothetical protein